MKSIDALSGILIETLKEFSSGGMGLTQDALSKALASKTEISDLLLAEPGPLRTGKHLATSARSVPPGPPAGAENHPLHGNRPSVPAHFTGYLAENPCRDHPLLSREENLQQLSELQQHIQHCESIDGILSLSDDLMEAFRRLIGQTIEEVEHTRGFLTELGRDLSGVEKQILSYHGIHNETYRSNARFSGELLSHADQMKDALDSWKEYGQVREFIVSRLTAVKSAVDIKQKEDEARLIEAEKRLSELQTILENHREEISQAKQRAEDLEKEVLLDSLTGIHNRRAYELRIREEIRRFHRDGQRFCLILIDVDHFKQVNDRYGHRTGDRCLREIASRIKSVLRNVDFVARYGGEEFTTMLPGSSLESSRTVAERIRALIEKTRFRYQEAEIPVTVSVGVTEVCATDEAPEAIFNRVDNAMYNSKNNGRNRITAL